LNKIEEFHRKYPDTPADPFAIEVEAIFRADEMDEDEEDREFNAIIERIFVADAFF